MAFSTTSRPQTLVGSTAGFTLLGVIIAIAVMNIFLGVAVTRWTFVNQRQREIELIWRGEQYTRALQCFIGKQGVPPTDLEELIEEHCIRRLYADPMSSSGEWRLLYAEDLGEEFADLVAGLAEDAETDQGGGPDAPDDAELDGPTGVRDRAQSRGGGRQRSSLLERMRSARPEGGEDSERAGFGSSSRFGSRSERGGSGAGSALGSSNLGGEGAGSSSASGLGLGSSRSQGDAGPAPADGAEDEPEGGSSGRQSLRERTKDRFKSRLAKRNLTGRSGRSSKAQALIVSAILGVATSSSGEAIRTYKQENFYEDWYFTMTSTGPNQEPGAEGLVDPQATEQGGLLPTDSGASGVRGKADQRQSRFRRTKPRRGG